jgi:hypothetical protein
MCLISHLQSTAHTDDSKFLDKLFKTFNDSAGAMADITLATVPLGIRAFTGCIEGYKLFTEAKEIGKGSQVLLWKFRIQETRFRMWGREWGLLVESGGRPSETREPEDHRTVLETLTRISDLLKDYKQLKTRYGLSLVSDDPGTTGQVSIDEGKRNRKVI